MPQPTDAEVGDFLRKVDRRRNASPLTALRTALGDANLLGVYVSRTGITAASNLVSQWDDARGASGFGPSFIAAGTARPTYNPATGLLVFDGVANVLRATGAALGGITDDCGLVLIATTGTSGGVTNTLTELADATPNNILAMRNATGSLLRTQAMNNTTTIDQSVAGLTGLRVFHARRTNGGVNTTLGSEIGSAVEQTTIVASGAQTAASLVVGASRALSNFLDVTVAGVVLYRGSFTGKQAAVNNFAQALLGANI